MTQYQLDQALMWPVRVRAKARYRLGFVDKAAECLVQRFGNPLIDNTVNHTRKDECLVQRSAWIDARVREVLKLHPEALGVELVAGLNTRFHRLSANMSWPQFEWLDIDSLEVASIVWARLPPTDNYRFMGLDFSHQNWLSQLVLVRPQAIVMVIEQRDPVLTRLDCANEINRLVKLSQAWQVPVFAVVVEVRSRWKLWRNNKNYVGQCLFAIKSLSDELRLKVNLRIEQSSSWTGVFIKITV